MGDGLLAEFTSVVDAVECAVVLQREMAKRNEDIPEERRIKVRIGINLGDVIVEGDDRHGDGVNIAARLQELAEPGGLAVSGTAYDHLQGKVETTLEFAGEQQVKNIARPVRVYRGRLERSVTVEKLPLALPDKPSIAVLPFDNLSGDPQQDYFADGVVEEIIMALSRMRWLFVIARNSSFTYKGRPTDVKQIGRELGVRYVLQGSVRKAGNQVRIAGQLIEAATGTHIWADRFDGSVESIFELQDNVTSSVVGAISPKLEQAEIERAQRKPTASLDAYDHFLRGLEAIHRWTRDANDAALANFYRAIEIDPNFVMAYGMAARCYCQRKSAGWTTDRTRDVNETERLACRAVELGRDDALALCTGGLAYAYVVGDVEHGAALVDRGLQLNPNLAWGWLFNGWVNIWLGKSELALQHIHRAMRLSPQDPQLFDMHTVAAFAHFSAGRYSEGISSAQAALIERPNYQNALKALAANYAMAEREEDAIRTMARLRKLDPELRVSNLYEIMPRRPDDFSRLVEAMRRAGLPE
jgi:TolB-like protein